MASAPQLDVDWWRSSNFEGVPLSALLRAHDIGAVFRFLRSRGWSRNAISRVTGLSENRVRQIANGLQEVREYHVFERIADGLDIDRSLLGLSFEDRQRGEPTIAWALARPSQDAGVFGSAQELARHWEEMLQIIAGWANERGAVSIVDIVHRQIALIDHQRRHLSVGGDVVLRVQARWSEFSSWADDNAGADVEAVLRGREALSQATEAKDNRLVGYILMRHAQQAAERGDGRHAVTLAEHARKASASQPRTMALCLVRQAQGHALGGELAMGQRCIGDALEYVARAPLVDNDQLDGHCTLSYVQAYEGYSRMLLGEPEAAVAVLDEVLAAWPPGMRQDEVLWRAWLARAYAMAGAPEQAGTEGLRALELAHMTGSMRAKRELNRLAAELEAAGRVSEAGGFLAAHRIIVAPGWRR